MSIRLTWLPNTEADVDNYQLWSSSDNTVYTLLATVDHDIGDPLLYDSSIGRFFYEDATGTTTTWYKVLAVDTAANESAFTVAKQPGSPLPPVCVLFGTVLKADGTAHTEAQVQIWVKSTEKTKEGQFVSTYGVTSDVIEVFADDNGYWEAELIRSADVRVVIPPINLDTEVTIPDAASADINTLI